jgi:nucleotide-binding universal stress UspA family protein
MSAKSCQVVVAFDFSHSGRTALDRGLERAERQPSNVLHVVCVLDAATPIAEVPVTKDGIDYRYAGRVQEAITRDIEEHLRASGTTGRVHFFVHARIGKASEEILQLAREVGADLIITGGGSADKLDHAVLGSVAEQVVRGAGCAVEVARPKTYPDVALLPIVDVGEHDHNYVPPHRYFYEDNRVNLRPNDWPLY